MMIQIENKILSGRVRPGPAVSELGLGKSASFFI